MSVEWHYGALARVDDFHVVSALHRRFSNTQTISLSLCSCCIYFNILSLRSPSYTSSSQVTCLSEGHGWWQWYNQCIDHDPLTIDATYITQHKWKRVPWCERRSEQAASWPWQYPSIHPRSISSNVTVVSQQDALAASLHDDHDHDDDPAHHIYHL